MSKVTQKDIAKHANTSVATVSRILSGQAEKYRIKKATVNRVLEVANEIGFKPYRTSYISGDKEIKSIAIIIPDIAHHYLSNFAQKMVARSKTFNYDVILYDSLEDTSSEINLLANLTKQNVDGVIVLPVGVEFEHLQQFYYQSMPIVVVDRVSPSLNCPTVSINNYEGAYSAVDYLTRLGHENIACVQRLPTSFINNQRVQAFKDVLQKKNIEFHDSMIIGEKYGQNNGYLEVKLLLNSKKQPTAIFALSHVTALGAIKAIREQGLRIPEDISLISFDDIPYAEYFSDPITSVRQPVEEMATMAVNLLVDQIENGIKDDVSIELPTDLVRRNSVKRIFS